MHHQLKTGPGDGACHLIASNLQQVQQLHLPDCQASMHNLPKRLCYNGFMVPQLGLWTKIELFLSDQLDALITRVK